MNIPKMKKDGEISGAISTALTLALEKSIEISADIMKESHITWICFKQTGRCQSETM
jgi:hypothetical protein